MFAPPAQCNGGKRPRLSFALKAVWTYGENQVVVTPDLEANAIRIIHTSSAKAPHAALHEFKPERRVTDVPANKPGSADEFAILIVRIQLISNVGTDRRGRRAGCAGLEGFAGFGTALTDHRLQLFGDLPILGNSAPGAAEQRAVCCLLSTVYDIPITVARRRVGTKAFLTSLPYAVAIRRSMERECPS